MKVNPLLLTILMFCLCQGISMAQNQPLLVAHKGASRLAPENTLSSGAKAVEMGADFLEIDVRRSSDGIYFAFDDETLDRTTNGIGKFSDQEASYLMSLDAGAWFRHSFQGERIPKIEGIINKFRESEVKFYFDFKEGNVAEFVEKLKSWSLTREQCLLSFNSFEQIEEYLILDAGYPLSIKINRDITLDEIYNNLAPDFIELEIGKISENIILKAHKKGIKVMGSVAGKQGSAMLSLLEEGVDAMMVDNLEAFSQLVRDKNAFPQPYLIAHRGGVVEDLFEEYDPASLDEAERRGYKMMEVDVRESKDGVLFVHHDGTFKRIYGDERVTTAVSWNEIKDFRSLKAGFSPMTLEEYIRKCNGRFDFMIDVKSVNKTPEFYHKLKQILEGNNMMSNLIFLDKEARKYFWGVARFGVRVRELPEIYEKFLKGEDVASNYYLFDHGMELTALSIKLAQKMHLEVIPSVNIGHYKLEHHMTGAERDIQYCRAMGVTAFQIDSDYDRFFESEPGL